MRVAPANEKQLCAWDGDEGEDWTAWEEYYNQAVEGYDAALFAGARVEVTDRLLDIGCGTGLSTRMAARAASKGSVLGVDLSAKMLERAKLRAGEEHLLNIDYLQADAQIHPFPPGFFDAVISRFGAMFFDEPLVAFRNLGAALIPEGRLSLVAWQPLADNGWVVVLREALAVGRDLPEPPVGIPGPFGLANPEQVRAVLTESGFVDISIVPRTAPLRLGRDPNDATTYVQSMGLCRGLLSGLEHADVEIAMQRLRRTLAEAYSDGQVALPSAAWAITATK